MTQPARVLIVEDDQYARNFMTMLIQRDGRLHIAGEISQATEIPDFLRRSSADLILLGGDRSLGSSEDILQAVLTHNTPSKLIYTPTYPEQITISTLEHPACQGCLFKNEIRFSLVWALILATQGEWVITPGVEYLVQNVHYSFKHRPLILDGLNTVAGMSAQEAEDARMAFLFYIEDTARKHPNLSQMLKQHIKIGFEKLNFDWIVSKKMLPRDYYANQRILLQYLGADLEQIWGNTRTNQDRYSLAFSLLTLPNIHSGVPVQS